MGFLGNSITCHDVKLDNLTDRVTSTPVLVMEISCSVANVPRLVVQHIIVVQGYIPLGQVTYWGIGFGKENSCAYRSLGWM